MQQAYMPTLVMLTNPVSCLAALDAEVVGTTLKGQMQTTPFAELQKEGAVSESPIQAVQ